MQRTVWNLTKNQPIKATEPNKKGLADAKPYEKMNSGRDKQKAPAYQGSGRATLRIGREFRTLKREKFGA